MFAVLCKTTQNWLATSGSVFSPPLLYGLRQAAWPVPRVWWHGEAEEGFAHSPPGSGCAVGSAPRASGFLSEKQEF